MKEVLMTMESTVEINKHKKLQLCISKIET